MAEQKSVHVRISAAGGEARGMPRGLSRAQTRSREALVRVASRAASPHGDKDALSRALSIKPAGQAKVWLLGQQQGGEQWQKMWQWQWQ